MLSLLLFSTLSFILNKAFFFLWCFESEGEIYSKGIRVYGKPQQVTKMNTWALITLFPNGGQLQFSVSFISWTWILSGFPSFNYQISQVISGERFQPNNKSFLHCPFLLIYQITLLFLCPPSLHNTTKFSSSCSRTINLFELSYIPLMCFFHFLPNCKILDTIYIQYDTESPSQLLILLFFFKAIDSNFKQLQVVIQDQLHLCSLETTLKYVQFVQHNISLLI